MANVDITKNAAAIAGKRFMPKVANATFERNGMIAFVANANTESDVNLQTTQNQIRAGQMNAVIGVITSEKTFDISFTTPEWKPEFLAANVGEEIKIGTWSFQVTDLSIESKSGKITLPAIPSDKKIYANINGMWVTVPVESTTVDLTAFGVLADECISVIGMFDSVGKRINLSADSDPFIGKLTLTAPIFEGTQGTVGDGQYVFPAFAMSGNFDHKMSNDTSYSISGQPIATASSLCGEGQTYGYYQEKIDNDKDKSFSTIVASPSVVELSVGETETISVYGIVNAAYEKTLITGATFATEDTEYFTVNASTGVITPVATGTGTITVTYNGLSTTVDVEVLS